MTARLFLHGRTVETYFDLLGNRENSITAALGWVLQGSHAFRRALLQSVFGAAVAKRSDDCLVHLQESGKHCGFTDVELLGSGYHLIIEAKRGWNLPGKNQLGKYCARFPSERSASAALLSLSECSADFADRHLPKEAKGRKVHHRSWRDLFRLAGECGGNSNAEKHLLHEFRSYLRRIVGVQNQESNLVYVVSLSRRDAGWGLTFVDVVEKHRKYFHPFGERNGWPKEPPNYLGFRYDGKLQSIHHVKKAEVIERWEKTLPGWKGKTGSPHLLYTLGPAISPNSEVRTGAIFRNGRVYAALDLLLTSSTVAEARDLTRDRLKQFS